MTFSTIIPTYRVGSEKSRYKHLNISETVMRLLLGQTHFDGKSINEQYFVRRGYCRFFEIVYLANTRNVLSKR